MEGGGTHNEPTSLNSKNIKNEGGEAMIEEEVDSSEDEIEPYPDGFLGVQKAYNDIQQIFTDVARDYPQYLVSDDEGDSAGQGDISRSPLPRELQNEIGGNKTYRRSSIRKPSVPRVKTAQISPLPGSKFLTSNISDSKITLPKILKPVQRIKRVTFADMSQAENVENRVGLAAANEQIGKLLFSKNEKSEEEKALTDNGQSQELENSQVSKTLKEGETNLRNDKLGDVPSSSFKKGEQASIQPYIDNNRQERESRRSLSAFRNTNGLPHKIDHYTFSNEQVKETVKDFTSLMLTKMNDPKKAVALSQVGSTSFCDVGPSGTNLESGAQGAGSSLKLIYTTPIWPHQEGLYKKLSKLSSLKTLILDDSKIRSLRELGSMLPNIITLSVMRCGLISLDGIFSLSNLENLFAADNFITDPSPLSACATLTYADLSDNQIENVDNFTYLRACSNLTCLKLMENPVTKRVNFLTDLKRIVPSLREIRPRQLEINGPDIFTLIKEFPDDDIDVKIPISLPSSRKESAIYIEGQEAIEEADENELIAAEVASEIGGYGVKAEELRSRGINTPNRLEFKKQSLSNIPHNMDEMDALLEELESSGGGSNIGEKMDYYGCERKNTKTAPSPSSVSSSPSLNLIKTTNRGIVTQPSQDSSLNFNNSKIGYLKQTKAERIEGESKVKHPRKKSRLTAISRAANK